MKLIVLRIPKATSKKDLRKLIENALARKFRLPFTEEPRVTSVKILIHEDDQNLEDRYGLIEVVPDSYGLWLIKHFKNQHLRGKLVFVREFFKRHSINGSKVGNDRRKGNKAHVEVLPHIESQRQFRRKY